MIKNLSNEEHFLVVGFKGFLYHINYALNNGIKISLLIEESKYKKEYDPLFNSVFIVNDIFDSNQIKLVIKKTNITSIFTRFEDYISVVGILNEHLSLEGINYQASRNFGNKYEMKKKWLEAKVPCAKGVCADNQENIKDFIKENDFPLILKKTSGTHSRFVYKVKSKQDLEEKLAFANSKGKSYKISKSISGLKESSNKECDLLLEEMLEGIEITVDTFISSGTFTHTPICKYVLPGELNIDDSYLPIRTTPTNLPQNIKKEIFAVTESALKALGANNCVCHTELFYNIVKNKCWVIETTPRSGGNRSLMINHVTNQDYDKEIFSSSAGKKVEKFTLNDKTFSIIEYFAEKEGIIEKIDIDFIKDIKEANIIRTTLEKGDKVKPAYSGGESIITVTLSGNDVSKTQKDSINIFNKIRKAISVK